MKYPGHKKTLEWYHARVCKTMKKQTQSIKHAVTYFHKHYIRLRLYISFYLLGISMLWLGGEWLIFFAVIPLISYIPHMQKMKLRQVLKDFYFGGVILCGFANIFLFQVAPENWTIELNGWFGVFSRLLSWLLASFICALAYVPIGFFLYKIKSFNRQLIALPFLFPLAELLRSYIFAFGAYGPHGNVSPNFNWGSLAVPASGTWLVYSSRLLGFFGLTFLVVLINIGLYLIIVKRKILIPLSILLAITTLTLLCWRSGEVSNTQSLQVAAIHFKDKKNFAEVDRYYWPSKDTDIIVLPEYSDFLQSKDYKKLLGRLSKDGVLITSQENGASPNGTNQVIVINKQGNVVYRQDKTFLIPTGEYMPYILQSSFRIIGKNKILDDFNNLQKLTKGKNPEQNYAAADNVKIGAIACSGVGALSAYQRLSDDGADILTNSASLSFLLPDSVYHAYAKNMARFQAVSNNKPFIQASRSGQSYIIDNQGNFIAISIGNEDQLLQTKIYK